MMKSKNYVELIGFLKDDPITYEKTDKVTKFVLVTSKTWIDKETKERKENCEYHSISCFNELADVAKTCLKKDVRVLVLGSLKSSKYTDKENMARYKTEIIADDCFITPYFSTQERTLQ